jgi:transposase
MSVKLKARYTIEFKLEAVRLVKAGQSAADTAKVLDGTEQTLYNWVKLERQGQLGGAGGQTRESRADGNRPAACRTIARQDGARHIEKATAFFAKEST